jgi:hypothetical protein
LGHSTSPAVDELALGTGSHRERAMRFAASEAGLREAGGLLYPASLTIESVRKVTVVGWGDESDASVPSFATIAVESELSGSSNR